MLVVIQIRRVNYSPENIIDSTFPSVDFEIDHQELIVCSDNYPWLWNNYSDSADWIDWFVELLVGFDYIYPVLPCILDLIV